MLEYLMSHGQGVTDLWAGGEDLSGMLSVIEVGSSLALFYLSAQTKQCLDTASPLPPNDAASVSNALLHLLGALPTPLVPLGHEEVCKEARDRDDAFAALEGISQVHTNVRWRNLFCAG